MPKVTSMQNSLTSGEWSPRGKGRTDLSKYTSGVGKMENFLINQLGGASFRPGSQYLATTKSSGVARLFPFQYSEDQDYVIEAGDLYFRLYSNSGTIITQSLETKLLITANGTDAYGILGGDIIDGGNTVHAVTKNGTAKLSGDAKKFGTSSLEVDGDSDYLTVGDHADFNFAAGSYTIDFQLYIKNIPAAGTDTIISHGTDGNAYMECNLATTGILTYTVFIGAANNITNMVTSALSEDTWYHIAIVVDATADKSYLFVDGVLAESDTGVTGTYQDYTGNFTIGCQNIPGVGLTQYSDCYIDEFRVVKGSAKYTAAFTAPTAAHTSDANTVLLLNMDTLDSSDSAHITTFVGTAQLDTAVKKFGTGSILLDGNSDYIQVPDHADFDLVNLATDNWTIDLWAKFADHALTETLICQYEDANNYWVLEHVHSAGGTEGLRFRVVSASATVITTGFGTGGEIPLTTKFYHIAVVKKSNEYGIYLDGVQVCYVNDTSTDSFAGDVYIGANGAPANYFQGSLDDVRITNYDTFSASPNSGLTDTIVIPTSEVSSSINQTEVVTPYLEADLFELQFAQNNDVMYIVHNDYAPYKLSRTGASAFSLSKVSFVRGPLRDTNTTATTITPSLDTGDAITLTASVATFNALHIDSLWRVKSGMVKITAYTSTTVVTGNVQAEPDGTAGDLDTDVGAGIVATTDWAEGEFSDYRGWPSAAAFHEQRLYYANTTTEAQKFWGSYIAAYESFDTTATTDLFSFAFNVATEQRNAIKWLSSGNKSLQIGAIGGTFSATAGDTTATIAPTNISVTRDTNYGVAALPPKRISSFLYYMQRDFSRLRELAYSFDIDGTISRDMTLLADHILKDGGVVVDLDHQQSPNDRIFCVRDDGQMAVLTRNSEQDVMGWCRFVAGTDAQGVGTYESVCVVPKSEADDQVWVVVKRNVDGSDVRYIEYFNVEDFDEDWDAIRVDSALTLDSPITITAATSATPVVITAASHGFADGDQVKINGVVGMTELNGNTYYVDDKTDDTFELQSAVGTDLVGAAYTTYISGGEVRKMVTAISGLSHLEGETVSVQTDGYIPSTATYVVASGAITLSEKAAVVHVGLPYTGTIQLLKLSDGSPTGTGQTRMRRIFEATLRLDRSQGLSLGRTSTTLDDLNYVDETDTTALFSGDNDMKIQTTWSKSDEIVIKQNSALPANILAIVLRSNLEEG